MDRNDLLKKLKPVRDANANDLETTFSLVNSFKDLGGFIAPKIATACFILEDMLKDGESFNFISFPAAIIATGLRGIIKEFVARGFFDAIITTTGTIDHDLARCFVDYYQGFFEADDRELMELQIHRLGSVFIPFENYGEIIEKHTQTFLEKMYSEGVRSISGVELINRLGEYIDRVCGNKDSSLIWWAWKKGIKIFVPGITDGAFGYQLWLFRQKYRDFSVDILRDEDFLSDIVYESSRTGALVIGGGISKHHVIWWNQFKGGLDRAVYITTAPEWDGSLSGARTREAISWGKISKRASHITIEGEATVILPLIAGYLFKAID